MRIISGEFGGRKIATSEGPGYRPATDKVRQAVFSMLEARELVWVGCRVLDVFAGSGSLGMEALSRGAEQAWFIEKASKAAALIKENLSTFKVDKRRYKVIVRDAVGTLRNLPPAVESAPFRLVFIDPPYGKDLLQPALDQLLSRGWLEPDAFVLAEVEESLEVSDLNTHDLELVTDRLYGQTRILLWRN